MGRYSYSQPSDSTEYGGEISEPYEYSEMEDLIHRDQEELSLKYGDTAQYPPQPEVEFGFPQVCYCDGAPKIATSYTRLDPGRRYYTCEHVDDGVPCVEMVGRRSHGGDEDEKVLRLEQLVCDLAKKKSSFINGFEVFIGVMLIVLVLLGLVIILK
uniref:Uncharacterized protein n=1 Tax=Brassica oleracea var. oleracea TaxID=109376 RepID=A0A0D3BRI2_BRAOL